MSTKLNPGKFDCYAKLLPDEPYFLLMGRDPSAPGLVLDWAAKRTAGNGTKPFTDLEQVQEAFTCCLEMRQWRETNYGIWRKATRHSEAFESQFTTPRAAIPESPKPKVPPAAPPRPNLAPGPWVHYKFGVVFELMYLALDEDAGRWMVVHRNRQTMNIFVRSVTEWLQMVETLDGRQVPRFREPDRDSRSDG